MTLAGLARAAACALLSMPRAKMQARYGADIPREEAIISPAAIYDSDLPTTVGTY